MPERTEEIVLPKNWKRLNAEEQRQWIKEYFMPKAKIPEPVLRRDDKVKSGFLKLERARSAPDPKLKASLNNTAWQRGLTWRNEKVNAVAEARRRGIWEEDIFRELKRAGLIDATAKAIMRDASYLEDSETTEMMPRRVSEYGRHPCWNCGRAIPLKLNFCSELCAKEYGGKKRKG